MFWAKRSQIFMTYIHLLSWIMNIMMGAPSTTSAMCSAPISETMENWANLRNDEKLGKTISNIHRTHLPCPSLLSWIIILWWSLWQLQRAPIKYGNVTVTHISIKCLGSPPDFRAIHETFPIMVGEIWTRGRFNRLPPSVHVTLSRKSLVLIVCAR